VLPATIKPTQDLKVNLPHFCPILTKHGTLRQIFMEVPDTCGRVDMTKVIGAFRYYANVPTKTLMVKHGDYSSIANCLTKLPAIFPSTLRIFRGIPKFLFIYFMTSYGTPNDVLPNLGRETLS
jgi:hypothetical protein